MTAGDPWQDTGNSRRSTPNVGPWTRALAMGGHIEGTPIGSPRWAPPFKPYAYNGTGHDTLTAFMDDEPDDGAYLTRRQERMQMLTSLPPVHSGPGPVPPPGHITVAQAAEQLGVSARTVERYKRDLATGRTG